MDEKTNESSSAGLSVAKNGTFEYHVNDCPVQTVVVYRDRAEVTRTQIIPVEGPGEIKVIVRFITIQSNADSLRVKTIDSNCDILEVSHEESYDSPASMARGNTSAKNLLKEELKKKIEAMEDSLKFLSQKLSRNANKRNLVQKYVDNLLGNTGSQINTRVPVDEARGAIAYQIEETEKLDEEQFLLEKEQRETERELAILKTQLSDISVVKSHYKKEQTRTLLVTIDTKSADPINLQFSYVVYNATWSPSYDIRVNSVENSLSLSYFAEVTQKTGENWNDCNLVLSTSNPAMGSSPPTLPSKTIGFGYSYTRGGGGNTKAMKPSMAMHRQLDSVVDRASFSLMDGESEDNSYEEDYRTHTQQSQMPSDFKKAGVVGSGDAGSTVFTINRKINIDSDNKPHKVMITARAFKPQIVHYAVPSVSAFVYLQAKVRNNSPYPLLASENVAIYLDGNFMSKSSIKQASSGESFQIFIGVDPAVKVEYLPQKTEEYKKSWMSGMEAKKVYHSTILHNTKTSPIKVIVAESLPRSKNEKIIIDLLEPSTSAVIESKNPVYETSAQDVISNLNQYCDNPEPNANNRDGVDILPKDFISKNKLNNNMVWFRTVNSQEKVQLNFIYEISWPQGNNISEH